MTDFQRFPAANAPNPPDELILLSPDQIHLPRRSVRGEPSCAEQNRIIRLSASVRRYGVLEPLLVRAGADENGFPCYELIDGERRLRAACLCRIERVPCRIIQPDAAETAKQGVLARLQDEKADFFTEAEVYSALVKTYHMTQEEIARRLSLSQSAVANKIRLLQFSPAEREQILRAGLCERHARALLRVRDAEKRRTLLATVIRGALTVHATEALVERALTDRPAPVPPGEGDRVDAVASAPAAQPGHGQYKFAVRDLRPLYNSIDRTLDIFRKTGAQVERTQRETAEGAEIVIRILRQG